MAICREVDFPGRRSLKVSRLLLFTQEKTAGN